MTRRWTTAASTCTTIGWVTRDTRDTRDTLDTRDTCTVQGDTGSGHTTPDTTRPKEVLDEVMAGDQGSSPFRPTWLYGFNSK